LRRQRVTPRDLTADTRNDGVDRELNVDGVSLPQRELVVRRVRPKLRIVPYPRVPQIRE